jgi:hypothetical protein
LWRVCCWATRDWQLTQEFWQHIVAVCVFIGVDNVRNLVLPLLEFHNASVRLDFPFLPVVHTWVFAVCL